jgi:hypothetical protein
MGYKGADHDLSQTFQATDGFEGFVCYAGFSTPVSYGVQTLFGVTGVKPIHG